MAGNAGGAEGTIGIARAVGAIVGGPVGVGNGLNVPELAGEAGNGLFAAGGIGNGAVRGDKGAEGGGTTSAGGVCNDAQEVHRLRHPPVGNTPEGFAPS